ncbi:hypothetical protein ANN_24214 [Periplaneta americana]|uniref:PKD/REJ-like domain-containing protein n=1 Tax=Periplaneta americana TaxID=6978 RepID=A0ABQ8S2G6_PERAM|nr:hypothetical protein ANN_24214 [Periplaneta americana]
MELTIPSLAAGSSVVCYVRRKDQQTVEVVQAAEVETGRVQCSAYVAQRASRMEWGAAYTWDAAIDREGCASPVNLTANALPPVMQLAQFTDDLRKVRIVFDHNVDGSENCADIFTPDTLSLLGNEMTSFCTLLLGANCSFVANSLIVTLGVNPTLQGNSTLQLRDDSKVFREQSDPSLTTPASGKVMLTSPDPKTSSPQFEVMAPMLICPDTRMGSALGRTSVMPDSGAGGNTQFIRIVPYGAQKLEYSWTVNFSAQAKDQRHNLMVWRSVRMLQTQLKKASKPLQSNQIAINTSMLMPGIEYKISVTAGNVLGAQSQTREFSFQVMNASGPGASQLVLKGPTTTRGDADLYLEAMLMSCEPQIMQPALNYQWNIDGDLAQKVELSKGSRLRLRSGVLQGGKTYNISVACSSDSKEPAAVINASAWQNVTVLSGGIQACISKQAVALGTGQALQLDASASRDLDHSAGNLQFSWCCQRLLGGRCLLPRAGEAVTLQSAFKNEFSQPVLSLPAGVLPVGRYGSAEYVFTVEVSKAGGAASKAQTLVEVMPGSPALVNVPLGMQLSPVNPKVGVTVPAVVMDTREGCRMWWSVLQEPGREFLDLAEVVGLGDPVLVTLEESRDVMGSLQYFTPRLTLICPEESFTRTGLTCREFPLVIPGPTGTWPGLKDNAGYKLRLSVACPKQQTSYADFLIITNSPPSVKALKVSSRGLFDICYFHCPIMYNFIIITVQVSPEEGEALRTRFTFSTEAADDSVADLPLLYRFGYRIGEQEPSHIFSMSNVELHADTILPAAMSVVPTLEVCDVNNLCSAVEGASVTVKLPTNLTLAEVQQVGAQFRDHVAAGQYVEAQSLALASLQTLKRLPDQSLHTAATEIIEAEIRKELKHQQDRLDMNSGSLQSSLDFLDMSIKVLSELPMSGSTLQDLVAFKDKILSLAKHSGELKQKYSSFSDRQKKPSRHRRSNQGSPQIPVLELKNVETMLKLSEREIKEGNSSAVLQAKKKLLNEVHTYMFNLCFGKEMLVALGKMSSEA